MVPHPYTGRCFDLQMVNEPKARRARAIPTAADELPNGHEGTRA
jgi:hypothetical protein